MRPSSAYPVLMGSPSRSPAPPTQRLAGELQRMSLQRDANAEQLAALGADSAALRSEGRDAQVRALEAVEAARKASAASRSIIGPVRPGSAPRAGGSPGEPRRYFGPNRNVSSPLDDPSYVAEVQARAELLQHEAEQLAAMQAAGSPIARPAAASPVAGQPQPLSSPQPQPAAAAATDYLATAASLSNRVFAAGPVGDEELKLAVAAFDADRYRDYQLEMDEEMERRAREGSYDSDVEREEEAMARDPLVRPPCHALFSGF